MTGLIGGALLLIAVATIILVLGWITADETLVWTSIVVSVVAGVLTALGYYRSKMETRGHSRDES